MRSIFTAFLFTVLGVVTVVAQNDSLDLSERKQGLSVKKLFIDYRGSYGGDLVDFRQYGQGFELGYHQRLEESFELYIPFRTAVASFSGELEEQRIFSLGVQGQYHFLKQANVFDPYVLAGINGTIVNDEDIHADFPLGLGLDINVHKTSAINLQLAYHPSSIARNNMNIGLGFKFYFIPQKDEEPEEAMEDVPVDSDGDGIVDELDLCPNEAGPEEFDGCPDSDGDGIPDHKDKCPKVAGLKKFDGCPDRDEDGVPDHIDECPQVAGPIDNNGCPYDDADGDGVADKDDDCPDQAGPLSTGGCPDTDGDGIADREDDCPNEKGPKATNGCPDSDGDGIPDQDDECPNEAGLKDLGGCPDADGDGIPDHKDACPDSPGPASNRGCPEIEEEEQELLDLAMDAVEFETGRATLKSGSFSTLNEIAKILKKYPDYKLRISGHTDNIGDAQSNQTLSEQRARSCYEYLASQGIQTSRMSYVGFGESKPRASNDSNEGRKQNRRVEFDLYLEDQ